jgi:hypothetical protein
VPNFNVSEATDNLVYLLSLFSEYVFLLAITIKDFICKLLKKQLWWSERYFIADKFELNEAACYPVRYEGQKQSEASWSR